MDAHLDPSDILNLFTGRVTLYHILITYTGHLILSYLYRLSREESN